MTRRHFRRSWGAEPIEGGARFRLWAPAMRAVALKVERGGTLVPMSRGEDGWFAVETDAVAEGDGYRFRLDDGTEVPDPAARAQVDDVSGPSRLVHPGRFAWQCDWRGRPWEEAVLYELHVGTFTTDGTFDAVAARLDHLAELGVTAVELMPVAQFGGRRGWGYDGALIYAPHTAYGGPDGLKRLVDAAHGRGLMVILDVVYNHFGPEGNYLGRYAPDFFDAARRTPWGDAIAFERSAVRSFFIENALYWLEEFRFDGLRLDAVDRIVDPSPEPILEELARSVHSRIVDRPVHLTTEDERNVTRLHERDGEGRARLFTAEWNDDVHHAAHVIATGETLAYYADYAERPAARLARGLATGYVYQGEPSAYRGGRRRGEPSGHLPPAAFISFLQNHDQVGNRALGERLAVLSSPATVEALLAVLLLSPQIPMLFMGEEWGETRPFLFFTDFHGALGRAVRDGRRREFADWPAFAGEAPDGVPDPNAEATFAASKLDWSKLAAPDHRRRLDHVRRLLDVRRREVVPLVKEIGGNAGAFVMCGDDAFAVTWRTASGRALVLAANFGDVPSAATALACGGRPVFVHGDAGRGELAPGGVRCLVRDAGPGGAVR